MTTSAAKSLYGFKPSKGDEDIVRHLSGLSMGVSEYLRALIRDDMDRPNGKWRRNPARPKPGGGIGAENDDENNPMIRMVKLLESIDSKIALGSVQIYSNEHSEPAPSNKRNPILDEITDGLGEWNPDLAAA